MVSGILNSSSGLRALLTVLLLLVVMGGKAMAAEVSAQLDRDSVTEGETVTLILQTDDPQQSLDTELDVLSEDFHIIDQRSETQMSIVNGRQSAVVRVMVTLEPKRVGTLAIPPLSFRGGSTTAPLTMTVEAAPELAPGEAEPVFIEVELDPSEGPYYVHAQLSLKVRIFYQQNLTEAAINPPVPEQASVRLLDEVPYQADRNGTRYRVLERRYAVFPERSGDMVIPPMQLTGRLIERPADRLWQPSVRGRRLRIESDPLSLEISPRPDNYSGDHWLPARRIDLAQQISDGDSVKVGEPVTRTIILDATGLEEHMLEEPVWPEMQNARIYPDQPQGISRDDGQWVLGHREYRYAVVPEQAGELVLPEIRLSWWDTVNNRQRESILPEHRVTVMPSSLTGQAQESSMDSGQASSTALAPGAGQSSSILWQSLTALFALLWIGTLLLLLRRRVQPERAARSDPEANQDEKALKDRIRRGSQAGDARATHEALGRWLRHHGPRHCSGSLMVWAGTLQDEQLAGQIRHLDAEAYGPVSGGSGQWDGAVFWKAFSAWWKQRQSAGKVSGELPTRLYAAARNT